MSKTTKIILGVLGVGVAALCLLIVGVVLFFDVNKYKPSIEAAASKQLGMQLKINGRASLRVFPSVRAVLRDIHLSNGGSEVFAAEELEVHPRLMPLLFHHEVQIDQLNLVRPKISIEKDAHGKMNYETATPSPKKPKPEANAGQKPAGAPEPGSVAEVSVQDGAATYTDRSSGEKTNVQGLNLKLSDVSWKMLSGNSNSKAIFKTLSLHGTVQIRSIQSGKLVITGFKSGLRDQAGVVDLKPTEFSIYGGKVKGSVKADLNPASPRFEVTQTATGIDLSQAAPTGKSVTLAGLVQGDIKLVAQGSDQKSLTKSARGNVALHNQGPVTIQNLDIDKMAATFSSAENLNFSALGTNLAALGTSFLGGAFEPSGKTVNVAGGSDSQLTNLVSSWDVANGVAQIKDFAFSTAKTTIAFRGSIGLLDRTYHDFYVAVVDPRGCAKAKQEIAGNLTHPKPVINTSTVANAAEKSALGAMEGLLGSKSAPAPQTQPGQRAGQTPAQKPAAACDNFYKGAALGAG